MVDFAVANALVDFELFPWLSDKIVHSAHKLDVFGELHDDFQISMRQFFYETKYETIPYEQILTNGEQCANFAICGRVYKSSTSSEDNFFNRGDLSLCRSDNNSIKKYGVVFFKHTFFV